MSQMTERCAVTIQPTLTQERLPVLAKAILEKLWPDSHGGIVWAHTTKLVGMLTPLLEFVQMSRTPQQFWVIRDGVGYRFEEA